MSKNIRRLQSVYHSEVKRVDGKFEITFFGRNKGDSQCQFKVVLDWWFWAYLVRDAFKAWKEERANRTSEILRVNAAFPPENQ